jgi:hypothetical protein
LSPTLTAPRRAPAELPRPRTRRVTAPRPARRVSGPVTGRQRVQAVPRERVAIGERALALVRGLPDHSLIDRLVRGRAWIPVLGVLLAGIVAMQVEILKLGTSMGRAMERSSALQTRNESLQASVATLADEKRIEGAAARMGMVMPRPESLVFLSGDPKRALGRAIANIHAPDPVGFASELAAEAAAAAALLPPPPPTVSSSGSTGAADTSAVGGTAAPSDTATATTGTAGATTGTAATTTGTASATTDTAATPTSGAATTGAATTGAGTEAASSGSGAAALAPSTSSQSGVGGG